MWNLDNYRLTLVVCLCNSFAMSWTWCIEVKDYILRLASIQFWICKYLSFVFFVIQLYGWRVLFMLDLVLRVGQLIFHLFPWESNVDHKFRELNSLVELIIERFCFEPGKTVWFSQWYKKETGSISDYEQALNWLSCSCFPNRLAFREKSSKPKNIIETKSKFKTKTYLQVGLITQEHKLKN